MLHARKFGLAAGIIGGIWMFLFTLYAMYTNFGGGLAMIMADLYPGYGISWVGALVGLIYGFIDSFVVVGIFALIYNGLTWREREERGE